MKIRHKIKFFKIYYQMSYLDHMQYHTKSIATNISFLNMHVTLYQKETNVYCTNLCCNSLQRERGSCVTELIPTSLGHELCDFIVILSTSSMWYFGMSHICIVWLYMSRKDASSSWNRTAVGLSTNFPRFLTETMKKHCLSLFI